MLFFILFGAIMIAICLVVKNKLQWTVPENNTCPIEEKDVKINKIAYKVILIIGIVSFLIGGIGTLLMIL